MKRLILPLLMGALTLSGCMRPYVMRLNNGKTLETAHKPKLKNGYYHYDDGQGNDIMIPASRVREIEPASMAKEEQTQFTTEKSNKKRHWYLLWLG